MSPAEQSLRDQFATYRGPRDRFCVELSWLPDGLFGSAAVWWFAHLPAPRYVREGTEAWRGRREVLKDAERYRREGGDCDDDVALVCAFAAQQGVPCIPQFLGEPARHVRTAAARVGFVDRVPGAPRCTWR